MFKLFVLFSINFILIHYSMCSEETENSEAKINDTISVGMESSITNRSPPETMLNIYNALTDFESKRPTANIPYDANTIQALLEQDTSISDLFKFNISTIKPGDMKEAELHVYILDSKISSSRDRGSNYYLLRIYQVMSSNSSFGSLNPDIHQLLNVHYIPVNVKGWQIFKVTRAVESWMNATFPNLGFLISATTIFGQPVELQVSRRDLHQDEHQPNLLIYNDEFLNSEYPDIFEISRNFERKKLSVPNLSQSRLSPCHLEKFDVNFKQIGWDFISFPVSYPANLCVGRCNNSKYNSTTPHATLMKLIGNNRLPHCVPEQLNSINILYFHGEFDVIFKTTEGLSVEKCHCR